MDPRSPRFRRLLPVWILGALVAVAGGILVVALLANARPQVDFGLPDLGSQPPDDGTARLLAVGDIASCDVEADDAVADLASRLSGEIALLGDVVYDNGTPEEFAACFDPAWGELRDRLNPVPGNHEYRTADAAGYFDYFGEAAGDPDGGWYAWEHGDWRMFALNTMCNEVGGCDEGSPQITWLASELAETDATCTLAYFHHPRYSSGRHGDNVHVEPLWRTLVEGGVDVTLHGHDHSYERLFTDGIRSFVVGTGGRSLYEFRHDSPYSEARTNQAYGLLQLTLLDDGYEWRFVALGSSGYSDTGTAACR